MSSNLDENTVSSVVMQTIKTTEEEILTNVSTDQSSSSDTISSVAMTTADDSTRLSFSELRAMFSGGTNDQERRPSSPGLDLTPVKEQQTAKVFPQESDAVTEANNNNYRNGRVLENTTVQSDSSISNSNSILDNSRASKPKAISFEIDLDDCVTRDCVTRDLSPSSRSRDTNNDSNISSVTTTEQESSPAVRTVEGLKKSFSFEINFDDNVGNNSFSPQKRRIKSHESKFKTSSPNDASLSLRTSINEHSTENQIFTENVSASQRKNVHDSKIKTSSPKENMSLARENSIEANKSKPKRSSPQENISVSPRDNLKKNISFDSPRSTTDDTISSNALPSSLSFEISFDDCETPPRVEDTKYENSSSKSKSSALSFEINFDDCKSNGKEKPVVSRKTSPRTKMSSFANHGLDDRPEKEPRTTTVISPSITTTTTSTTRSSPPSSSRPKSRSTTSPKTRTKTPTSSPSVAATKTMPAPISTTTTQQQTVCRSNHNSEQNTENSDSGHSPLYDCRNVPHYQSLDTFPEKESSETNQDDSMSSISFDISFDDDLQSTRKTKLAPKHIRLKMSKRRLEDKTAAKKEKAEKNVPLKDCTLLSTTDSNTTNLDTNLLDENRTATKAGKKTRAKENTPLHTATSDAKKRDTYTLDEVSKTLQEACLKGETLEQALDSLAHKHDQLELTNENDQNDSSDEANTTVSKRDTYSLDEVSKCLVDAANSGHTLTQALEALALSQEAYASYLNDDGNLKRANSLSKKRHEGPAKDMDDESSPKRRTWNLTERKNKGFAVDSRNETKLVGKGDALNDERKDNKKGAEHEVNSHLGTFNDKEDDYTNDLDNEVTIKRGTYDLNDVSRKIDNKKDSGNSLEQALEQLLDEVESAVHDSDSTLDSTSTVKRGTYDLEKVSVVVQNLTQQGVPVEESLDRISSQVSSNNRSVEQTSLLKNNTNTASSAKTPEKRGTWNLDDFGDPSLGEVPIVENRPIISEANTADKRGTWNLDDADFEDSTVSNDRTNTWNSTEKRGTYNLDDVAKQLDSTSGQQSVVETLSNMANNTTNEPAARNTYTLDEVAQSLEVAKTKGIPIVQALSTISDSDVSSSGSRGTYPLDEVAESIESAREKGLPIVMALENLISKDDGHKKEPESVAIHRRQGKLTNRKTYALASPLETIGEDNQLKLFDGTSRKFITMVDPMSRFYTHHAPQAEEDENSSGKHVMKTLDLLTSACEALLRSRNKETSQETLDDSQVTPKTETENSEDVTTKDNKEVRRVEATPVESTPPAAAPPRKRIPRAVRIGNSKSESNLNTSPTRDEQNRQTYSLDSVSNSVESAKAKGIPVIAALDELTNSLAQFSATGAKAMKNGKKPIKKPDRPSIRKRQAARERAGVVSEAPEQTERPKGAVFPISYPPAMRNSYSLDDVASALEMAYKTGASFEDFLCSKQDKSEASNDTPSARSTGTLVPQDENSVKTCPTTSADSVTLHSSSSEDLLTSQLRNSANVATSTDSIALYSSSSEDQLVLQPRKNSSSSEGGLSYSSSNSSDLSSAKDLSMEDLAADGSVRNQRKRSTGPFQLRRKRRGSSTSLTNVSASANNTANRDADLSSSRDSNLSGSDTSLQKRGTYDLKQVSKELDSLKQQGLPVVKALDQLGSCDNIAPSGQRDDVMKTEEHSRPNKTQEQNSVQNSVGESPKRNVLEDTCVSKAAINVSKTDENKNGTSKAACSPIHTVEDTGTRNTFTLDHVEDSIEDAHKRGIPVVDILDKLSSKETPKRSELKQHIKAKFKTFTKPQTNNAYKDEFFIEFFPSKTELKSPRHKMENYEDIEVSKDVDEQKPSSQNVNSKMSSKITSTEKDEFFIEFFPSKTESASPRYNLQNGVAVNVPTHVEKQTTSEQDTTSNEKSPDTGTDKTRSLKDLQSDSLSGPMKTSKTTQPDEILYSKDMSTNNVVDEEKQIQLNNTSERSPENATEGSARASGSRPRWQHTGSYIEALNSFEQMIETEHEPTDELAFDIPASIGIEEVLVSSNEPKTSTSDLIEQLRDSNLLNKPSDNFTSETSTITMDNAHRTDPNRTSSLQGITTEEALRELEARAYSASNDLEIEAVSVGKVHNCSPTNDQLIETADSKNKATNTSRVDTAESDYSGEAYDTMTTETSPRSRWRPSGSVLGQILSLMDDAEERGLSIADALEQAAELSEKQGLFHVKRNN